MLLRLVVGKILERRLEVNGAGSEPDLMLPLYFNCVTAGANSGSRSEVCPPVCQLRLQTRYLGVMQHA